MIIKIMVSPFSFDVSRATLDYVLSRLEVEILVFP